MISKQFRGFRTEIQMLESALGATHLEPTIVPAAFEVTLRCGTDVMELGKRRDI
jgi:hypothetical protein